MTNNFRRPHGGPPGSKPKPKPSLPITRQSCTRVVISIDSGRDIMESILDVARQNHVSLTIINACGMIDEATLCTSNNGSATTLTLHGPFKLLSLSGSYLYKNHYTLQHGATPPSPLSFGIHLAGSSGQVFSGIIGGKVLAGDDVTLTLSTFKNPTIYKFVPEGEERDDDDDDNNPNDFN